MKKRKLLLLVCAVLISGFNAAYAGILDGWTKMETSVVGSPENYYFIILHTDNSLMLGVTKSCDIDGGNTNSSSTYDFISYQTATEPSMDLNKVWSIESCTAENRTSAYVLRSLGNVDNPANIGSYQWELKTEGAIHENKEENGAFNIVADGTFWNIQDATSTSYYWGAWNNATYTNNQRVAGNAGGNGNAKGCYNIYYMSRTTFNQKYQFFGGTDMNHAIVNRDFEYGNSTGWSPDETETATLTIKNSATSTYVSKANSGSYYCYMKRDGGWAAAKQTINNLPSGTYSSTIYLCNDINFLFNNTSAESWAEKTPSGSWTAITISDQNITSGSTELKLRGWGDNRFADDASLTYMPNKVSDDASAYTLGDPTTALTWYSVTIENAGNYILSTSAATSLRYTTSSTAKPEDATDITLAAGEKHILSLPAGTFYFGTSSATQVNLSTDFTYYINNPSFETGYKLDPVTGWTVTVTSGSSTNANCRYKGDDRNAIGDKDGGSGYVLGFGADGGNIRFSIWTANAGAGSVSQTLTSLPAGNYKLSAYLATGANSTLTLSAGSTYRTIRAASSDPNLVEVYFTQASTGNVEIKATCNASWFDADNFKLVSIGELPASLTGITGIMNATVASTQSTAIATYTGSKTFANLLAAQTAMNAALASKLIYEEISSIQSTYATRVESLDEAGQEAYETAINTTTTGAAWKYDNGVYETAAEAETAFHNDYITAVKAQTTDNTDMTEVITNPSFETGDMTGWTANSRSDTGVKRNDNATYSISEGVAVTDTYLFNSWGGKAENDVHQTISLPSGNYRLTALLAGFNGETLNLTAAGQTGSVVVAVDKTYGYDVSVDFSLTETTNVTIKASNTKSQDGSDASFIKADNFRLTYLSSYYALEADYTALSTAITSAEDRTLGFEDGEYAPYNNIAILTKLNEAKEIMAESPRGNHLRSDVLALISDLESDGSWTANDGDVECVYNGDFFEGQGSAAANIQNYGWTRTNGWGQFQNGSDKSSTSKGTSYYNQPGSLQYGNAGYYTMPLKASTIYTLTFKYASWTENSNNSVTASVLKSSEGMAAITYGASKTVHTEENAFVTKSIKFVTKDAGNYVLTLANDGNTVLTDVSITKAANQYLEFADDAVPTYAPGTYPSVKITRSLTANRWATAVYPFAVSGVDKIAVLDNYNTETQHIRFTSAEASTANVPFLMRSTTNKSEISLSDVEVSAAAATPKVTINDLSLIGTYSEIDITDAQNNYVLSANTIYPVGDKGAKIPAFRAYIQDANSYEAARSLQFVVDDEVTAIEGISDKNYIDGTVYNINGQVVRKNASTLDGLKKGVYIVNGQRVIVK